MSAPLRLMSHNPLWAQEFEQSRSTLLHATEGWLHDVRHIGGTSFGEGVAQPVIDMLAGIDDMQGLNAAATLIEGLNYRRLPAPDWCSAELTAWLQKPRGGAPSHSLLVVRLGGVVWQRTLDIQNSLRENVLERQRLQNVKLDHFTAGCDAPERYARAKQTYFADLERRLSEPP